MKAQENHQTIIVAEHHPLFRQECSRVLQHGVANITVIEASTVSGAMLAAIHSKNTRLLLFGLSLPDTKNFSGLIEIRSRFPHINIGVVSAKHDPSVIEGAFANGATGYIPKTVEREDLKCAVKSLLIGRNWVPSKEHLEKFRSESAMTPEKLNMRCFTPKQSLVLDGLHRGLSNKKIANELGMAASTAKVHVSKIMKTLGVCSRTQIVLATKPPDF